MSTVKLLQSLIAVILVKKQAKVTILGTKQKVHQFDPWLLW